MRKLVLTIGILGAMVASAYAHGHGHGHGHHGHGKWYKKQHHVHYARPVVYHAPQPVHVVPATPVVYQPAPVVQPRGVYFNVGGTL